MPLKNRWVDENLIQMDALCQKWATDAWDWSSGSSQPIWKEVHQRGGRMTVSDEVMALDGVFAKSDKIYRAIVVEWYVRGGSVAQKAKKLNTNRTDLYGMWRRTLEYLRGRLHSEGIRV